MDTMNPVTTTVDDWRAHADTLLIGRRGSTTLGLNMAGSDIDWMVVTRTTSTMERLENVMLDTNVITIDRFKHMSQIMEIEAVETLWNMDQVLPELEEELVKWMNLVKVDERCRWLFWYRVWLMLKNQIKQYRKGTNDNKFGAKVVLYGRLLDDADILDYWTHDRMIPQFIKEEYWGHRVNGLDTGSMEYFREVEALRKDSSTRLSYREQATAYQQSLEREAWFVNFLKDW